MLTIAAGGISGGSASLPAAAAAMAASPGSAFGAGIFIQGNQTITLAPAAGQTLTIGDAIADQTGSGGTAGNAGAGVLSLAGAGNVVLASAGTFTGGVSIGSGGTLSLAVTGAAGSGHIRFVAGATLAIASGITVANTLDTIHQNNVIDVAGITGATAVVNGTTLTISGTGGSVTLQLDSGAYQQAFAAVDDGAGGTAVTYTACYAAGTRIATPRARRRWRRCAGDPGAAGGRRGGRGALDGASARRLRAPSPAAGRGTRAGAGACLRPRTAARDLVLSPDHAVFVEGDAEGGARRADPHPLPGQRRDRGAGVRPGRSNTGMWSCRRTG